MFSFHKINKVSFFLFSSLLFLSMRSFSAEVIATIDSGEGLNSSETLYRIESDLVCKTSYRYVNQESCSVEYSIFSKTTDAEEKIFNLKLEDAFQKWIYYADSDTQHRNGTPMDNRSKSGIVLPEDSPLAVLNDGKILLQGGQSTICNSCQNVIIFDLKKLKNETELQRTNIVKNVPVKINDPDFQDVLPVLVIVQEIAPQTNYGSKTFALSLLSLKTLQYFGQTSELWGSSAGSTSVADGYYKRVDATVTRVSENKIQIGKTFWKFSEEFKAIVPID